MTVMTTALRKTLWRAALFDDNEGLRRTIWNALRKEPIGWVEQIILAVLVGVYSSAVWLFIAWLVGPHHLSSRTRLSSLPIIGPLMAGMLAAGITYSLARRGRFITKRYWLTCLLPCSPLGSTIDESAVRSSFSFSLLFCNCLVLSLGVFVIVCAALMIPWAFKDGGWFGILFAIAAGATVIVLIWFLAPPLLLGIPTAIGAASLLALTLGLRLGWDAA